MNENEIEEIRDAVEGHKEEANIKECSNRIVKTLKDIAKEEKNNKAEPIMTNDQIIDQGKKVKFKVPIDFLSHTEYLEYETTEAGLNHFKGLLDPNKDQREFDQAVEMEKLTFLDGVLLTWNIFNKILDNRLRDENGDPEQGICKGYAYEYLGIINDDITDLLLNEVLELGYFKHHSEHLHELFEIGSRHYMRPAWMYSEK